MYGYMYAIMVSALWGGSVLLESSIIAKFSPAYLYVIGGLVFGLTSLSVLIVNWKTLLPMFANAILYFHRRLAHVHGLSELPIPPRARENEQAECRIRDRI